MMMDLREKRKLMIIEINMAHAQWHVAQSSKVELEHFFLSMMVGIYLALLFNNALDFALLTGLDLALSIGFRLSINPKV